MIAYFSPLNEGEDVLQLLAATRISVEKRGLLARRGESAEASSVLVARRVAFFSLLNSVVGNLF